MFMLDFIMPKPLTIMFKPFYVQIFTICSNAKLKPQFLPVGTHSFKPLDILLSSLICPDCMKLFYKQILNPSLTLTM